METNDDRTLGPRRATIAVAVASLLVAVSVVIVITQIPVDSPPTTTEELGFDGFAASKVGYEWWNAVSSGSISDSLTHPDSSISDRSEIPRSEDFNTISVDAVPFGSLSEPQLCYILTSSAGQQHTGSMVFRNEGETWLVWEIRPDVDSCYVPVGPDP